MYKLSATASARIRNVYMYTGKRIIVGNNSNNILYVRARVWRETKTCGRRDLSVITGLLYTSALYMTMPFTRIRMYK